jgi:hypothetical protein
MAASATSNPSRPAGGAGDRLVAWLIGPVFLVLAAAMFATRDDINVPHTDRVVVARQDLTSDPPRRPLADPPRIEVAGFDKKCSECHRLFESALHTPPRLTQHCEVVTDHGINDRCFNCHDRENRNLLVLNGGETIDFAESSRLCAECHGPVWRDWEHGVHGRTVGYWDASRGTREQLSCVECHDPHVPAYEPMRPLPGPHTLRMGDPSHKRHLEAIETYNPLLHWRRALRGDDEAAP